MEPIKQGEEVLQYIPQRAPFVMVDKLYEVTEKTVTSGLKVENDNILVDGKVFQESGLIENMAQTCALYAGYKANELGKEAPVGFIAGLKNVAIKKLPEVGDELSTTIEITNEMMNMQIAMATVYNQNKELVAGCELRIFIKEEE